jgi:NAD+ diphosphatase
MNPYPARRPNTYTASPIDRASNRREDEAWIASAFASADALFVPVWRSKSLVHESTSSIEAAFLTGDAAAAVRLADGPWAFLGLLGERPIFVVDVSAAEDPAPLLPPELGASFAELRAATLAGLPANEAAILAHARALMHWRSRHRFCGVCGTQCDPKSAGNVMICPNCGTHHFPRTDPAVIMLVTHDDRALLGQSHRFPRARMYSTLAGFVEPGESLEEAVRREVREEASIELAGVWYHSSQPWPYPAQIMLGFVAEATTEEIVIDPEELRDARWFSRAQVRDREAIGFELPPDLSIARRLIDDWLAGE